MRSWVLLSVAALTWVAFAGSAQAGANAGATVRLAWGGIGSNQINNTVTVDTVVGDTVNDFSLTLWVSVKGVTNISGLDMQLLVLSDRGFGAQFALPNAWQFTDPGPCGDPGAGSLSGNMTVVTGGLGTNNAHVLQGVPGLATSQNTMKYNVSGGFENLWVIWYSAAGGSGVAKSVTTRYAVCRIDFIIPGGTGSSTPCAGQLAPICIQPNLRLGYNAQVYPAYIPQSVVLVDGASLVDFAALETGHDHVTANYSANTGLNGCPAPTRIRSTTWGGLRRLYK
jgi:hypothetical protein